METNNILPDTPQELMEGVDFFVEVIEGEELPGRFYGDQKRKYEIIFRGCDEAVLGYLCCYIQTSNIHAGKYQNIVIEHSVSAYSQTHLSDKMKTYLEKNGYILGKGLSGFGVDMYGWIIKNMAFEIESEKPIILVASERDNNHIIWNLLKRVQERYSTILEGVNGGDSEGFYVATITVKK
ncbi:hypothetical protein LAT59_00540 [Candidatus Gracilibacteria bacterium]|nr:hypothetical protein [Candidatus Gracilibacteria bacterium]